MLNINRQRPSLSTTLNLERLIERFSHLCKKKRWGILLESRSMSKQLERNFPALLSQCLKSSAEIHTLLYKYSAVQWWSTDLWGCPCSVMWSEWGWKGTWSVSLCERVISIPGGHQQCTVCAADETEVPTQKRKYRKVKETSCWYAKERKQLVNSLKWLICPLTNFCSKEPSTAKPHPETHVVTQFGMAVNPNNAFLTCLEHQQGQWIIVLFLSFFGVTRYTHVPQSHNYLNRRKTAG